jgi:hypothetical protein
MKTNERPRTCHGLGHLRDNFVTGCTESAAFASYIENGWARVEGLEWIFLCATHARGRRHVVPLSDWFVVEAERHMASESETDVIRRVFRIQIQSKVLRETPLVAWMPDDVSKRTPPVPKLLDLFDMNFTTTGRTKTGFVLDIKTTALDKSTR